MTNALLARKYLALGIAAVVVGFLCWSATLFDIDASADTLLTQDNEKFVRSKATTQRFSPQEFLLVAYEPRDGALFSNASFADIRELSRRITRMERVLSVRSILNVPLLTIADSGSIGDLKPGSLTVEAAGFRPDEVAAALRDHPIYEGLLIDSGQRIASLQVLFRSHPDLDALQRSITRLELAALEKPLSAEESARLAELRDRAGPIEESLASARYREVETIRELAAEFEDRANIRMGGVHVLGYELVRIVRNDIVVFGAAVAIVIALLLWILFREFRWVWIAGVLSAAGIGSTMGLFGLLGLPATVVSANFVALQLILTLAVVVHLIVQYREFARRYRDRHHEQLIAMTMSAKTAPCIYAAGTTALGFAALLASGFQPVVSFGWMMIVATGVTLLATLTLFPVLLSIAGGRSEKLELPYVDHWLRGLARLATGRGRWIAVATVLFAAICTVGAARLDVENSFIDYFDDDTSVHRDLAFIDRNLGGSTPLDLVYGVARPAEDLLLDARQFTTLQKLDALLRRHDGIGKSLSLANFAALAREVNGGKPMTEYEMTAAWRIMDREIRDSLLGAFYSPETRELRIGMRVQDTTPQLDRGKLLEAVRNDARAVLGPDTEVHVSNLFVLYQDILERLFDAQIATFGLVLAALFVAFLAIFRSIRIALIALLPNVLITVAVFGAMGWLGISLDLMTITIAAVAMGIAVDDTIHYIHRFRTEAVCASGRQAVERSHRSVGYAIVYTTIAVVAGFSSLAFSDFVPSALFGLLTGLALIASLIFDLTVLPALLRNVAQQPGRAANA